MRAAVIAVIVVIVLLVSRWDRSPSAVSPGLFGALAAAEGTPPDTCAGKAKCLVVYTAPWCSTCHAAIPFLKEAAQQFSSSSHTGFKIVIGTDEPRHNKEMAALMPGFSYLDNTGAFASALHVSAFPTWIMLDAQGQVLRRFASGAPDLYEGDAPSAKALAVRAFLEGKGVAF